MKKKKNIKFLSNVTDRILVNKLNLLKDILFFLFFVCFKNAYFNFENRYAIVKFLTIYKKTVGSYF